MELVVAGSDNRWILDRADGTAPAIAGSEQEDEPVDCDASPHAT
jgi:hypothetical protein